MSVGTVLQDSRGRAGRGRAARSAAPPAGVGLAALVALAVVLRFWRLGHQGFWFDEGNTVLLVHLSVGHMLGLLPHSESTPPLYYLIAWLWARVFGFSEVAIRSLSALCGVLCVPVAFLCGRRLASERAGLVAAALVACNPLLIWYSQEARSYALLVLLSALSLLAWLAALEAPSGRRVALWVLASAAALCTHYYALVLVAPCALWLLARTRGLVVRGGLRAGRASLAGLAVLVAGGLALLPLAIHQNRTGNASWIHHAALGRRMSQIVPQFLAGFAWPGGHALVWAAGLAALVGVGFALWPESGRSRLGGRLPALEAPAWAMAALVLGGVALNLVLVAAGFDDLLTRNLLALWLPAALVVAAGLARRPALGALCVLVLCGAGIAGTVAVDTNRAYQRPDWRGVAALLGSRPALGERVVFVQHYRDLLPLSLYLPGLRFLPHGRAAHVRELDVVTFTSPRSDGFCWWGPACNLWPSRLQSAYPVPGFRQVWVRRFHQFSVMRLVAAAPVRLSAGVLQPAVHATRLHNDELLVQR